MNIQWTWGEYLGDLKDQQIGTSRFSMESGDMTGHENDHPLLVSSTCSISDGKLWLVRLVCMTVEPRKLERNQNSDRREGHGHGSHAGVLLNSWKYDFQDVEKSNQEKIPFTHLRSVSFGTKTIIGADAFYTSED